MKRITILLLAITFLCSIGYAQTQTAASKAWIIRSDDFTNSQGLLPPALIREAVMKDFVPEEK